MWPKRQGANYNVWKQSTNPVMEKTKVQGYEAVDVKFKYNNWGGLESGYLHSHNPTALLDGSVNHGKVHVCTFGFARVLPLPTTAFFFTPIPQQTNGSTRSAALRHIITAFLAPTPLKRKSNFTSSVLQVHPLIVVVVKHMRT